MARFVKLALFTVILTFIVNSSRSETQEFVGPKLYEISEKSTRSPITSNTAIATKDDVTPHVSVTIDEKERARIELLDYIKTMDAYVKLVAEEFAKDGIVVVRAVKAINIVDPPGHSDVNDRDNNEATARFTKPVRSANISPFKTVAQGKCDKKEAIIGSSNAVD